MTGDTLRLLRLLQLADSALPIGAAAHSFGLETLAAEGALRVDDLEQFFSDCLAETGMLEGAFCRASHDLVRDFREESWLDLNRRLSALKPARESRAAGATLGRRFLEFVLRLLAEGRGSGLIENALSAAKGSGVDAHYATAFGLAGGALSFDREITVLAYLHQLLAGWISACQRLLPLGQNRAAGLLWRLKPLLIRIAQDACAADLPMDNVSCFAPMLELAAMRHPGLGTRLFIS